jgi:hypothetical protein
MQGSFEDLSLIRKIVVIILAIVLVTGPFILVGMHWFHSELH